MLSASIHQLVYMYLIWIIVVVLFNSHILPIYLQLKVYASTQWSHSADLKYKGYSCVSDVTVGNIFISILVLTVVLTTLALMKTTPKLYQKVTSHVERGNQWYSFFWAASFMTSLCNIAVLLVEITLGWGLMIYSYQDMCSTQWFCANSIRVTMMYLLILLDFLVAICIIPKSAEFPIPSLVFILSFPLSCTCCCCTWWHCRHCRHPRQLRSKWIQTLALTSLLLFTQTVAISALPIILTTFIYPTETLAAIASFAAAIFCTTALIALLLRNIGQLACGGRCRDNCYSSLMQLLLILMVTLFLAIMILSCFLYIKLITSGGGTNQIGGFLVSFLPSATLTIIGWFVTKGKFIEPIFPHKRNSTRSRSQIDPPTEQTPLNLPTNV